MEISLSGHRSHFAYAPAFENSAEVVSPETLGLWICDMDRAFCDMVVKKLKG